MLFVFDLAEWTNVLTSETDWEDFVRLHTNWAPLFFLSHAMHKITTLCNIVKYSVTS